MGQSTSKGLSKVAERAAKHSATQELKLPPIPRRTPIKYNSKSSTGDVPSQTMMGNKEMPEDLLKFIQDIGPAKQSVDREFTTPRLLREENKTELDKVESVRTARRRQRVRMPLMGYDTEYTTEKNTNFSVSASSDSSMTKSSSTSRAETFASSTTTSENDDIDFGLSNFELYDILSKKDFSKRNDDNDTYRLVVENYYERRSTDSSSVVAAANLGRNKEKLSRALQVLDVPALCVDSDGNLLGVYQHVHDPEVKSISTVPESKVMLVLKHLTRTNQ